MSENQESDNNNSNINKGLGTLEENVRLAKEENEIAESEYNEVHDRAENLKDMLKDYTAQKENAPHEYDFIIAITIIVALVTAITATSLLLGNLALIFLKLSLWLGGIISLGCIPLAGFIEVKLSKKLQDKVENIIHNKIISSEEYQKILIQLESIEEDLKQVESEEITKKINMRNATANYSAALSELKMKQSMLNYYPKTETISKEVQGTKSYTRKRTNRYRKNKRNTNQ